MDRNDKIRQIVHRLTQRSGSQIITLEAITEARLRKLPPNHPLHGKKIYKRAVVNGIVGANYEGSVNRQRAREGREITFKSDKRTWGEHAASLPIITHKGGLYLQFQVLKRISESYECDGASVDLSLIQDFIPAKPKTNQGTDKSIEVRNYALDKIIRLNDERFQ